MILRPIGFCWGSGYLAAHYSAFLFVSIGALAVLVSALYGAQTIGMRKLLLKLACSAFSKENVDAPVPPCPLRESLSTCQEPTTGSSASSLGVTFTSNSLCAILD